MRASSPACRALIDQIYGVGGLTAVTILAELGDARRFQNSRDVVRYAGMDITVYQSDAHRAPGHLSRQGPPALRWALYEAAQRARFPASPDRATTSSSPRGSAATARASRSRANCSNAATTSSKPSATRRSRPSPDHPCHAASPKPPDEPRPAPGETAADPSARGRPRKNERPHHHLPEHPITHHAAGPEPTRVECRSKPGRPRTRPIPPNAPTPPGTPHQPRPLLDTSPGGQVTSPGTLESRPSMSRPRGPAR